MSAKLLPMFVDRGVSRSQRGGSHTAVIWIFLASRNNIMGKYYVYLSLFIYIYIYIYMYIYIYIKRPGSTS
jgi:hypothetical protein